MRVRSTLAAALLTATVSVPLAGAAAAADLDCADFPNQAAAQVVLDADPAGQRDVDRNGNGIACETYPYGRVAVSRGDQVATPPVGGVDTGDGSSAGRTTSTDGGPLGHLVGGLALAAAGAAALASRRTTRS